MDKNLDLSEEETPSQDEDEEDFSADFDFLDD